MPGFTRSNLDLGALVIGRRSQAARHRSGQGGSRPPFGSETTPARSPAHPATSPVSLAAVRTSTQVPGFTRSNLDLGALAVGRRSLAARHRSGHGGSRPPFGSETPPARNPAHPATSPMSLAAVRTSTQVPGFTRSNLDLGALAVGRRSLAARHRSGQGGS